MFDAGCARRDFAGGMGDGKGIAFNQVFIKDNPFLQSLNFLNCDPALLRCDAAVIDLIVWPGIVYPWLTLILSIALCWGNLALLLAVLLVVACLSAKACVYTFGCVIVACWGCN